MSRRQVAEVISKRIADGTYPPGSRVSGIVDLSAEFGIAASTAQKALAHLLDTGEVRTEQVLGTFVADSKSAGSNLKVPAGGTWIAGKVHLAQISHAPQEGRLQGLVERYDTVSAARHPARIPAQEDDLTTFIRAVSEDWIEE